MYCVWSLRLVPLFFSFFFFVWFILSERENLLEGFGFLIILFFPIAFSRQIRTQNNLDSTAWCRKKLCGNSHMQSCLSACFFFYRYIYKTPLFSDRFIFKSGGENVYHLPTVIKSRWVKDRWVKAEDRTAEQMESVNWTQRFGIPLFNLSFWKYKAGRDQWARRQPQFGCMVAPLQDNKVTFQFVRLNKDIMTKCKVIESRNPAHALC